MKKVGDAAPNPENPRRISAERLQALGDSMHEHGDLSALVLNERTGRIVGGNQRHTHLPEDAVLRVWKRYDPPTESGTVAIATTELDGEPWFVRIVDVEEETERRMMVAANAHGGEWEEASLARLVSEWRDSDRELLLAGLTEDRAKKLLERFDPDPPDDFPEMDPDEMEEDHRCPSCGYEWNGACKPDV